MAAFGARPGHCRIALGLSLSGSYFSAAIREPASAIGVKTGSHHLAAASSHGRDAGPRDLRLRRRYHSHVDQLEAQAVDPLQESLEGALIWQFGSKRRGARAHTDFAVVEFRAQGTA